VHFEVIGKNRVFYKASNFQEGLTVSAYVVNPDLTESDNFNLVEIADGIYYFDYVFKQYGKYGCLIRENGEKKLFVAIQVGS